MKPVTTPLFLTPRDEDILRAVYNFRYMTAKDVAYRLFSPTILNYVRNRLSRLSGGTDLAAHTYLCRSSLPGTGEKIFTLGAKGRDFLAREAGLTVDFYFRPYRLPHFSFSHLLHALVLTRCLVAAASWSRSQRQYTLSQIRTSYELARIRELKVVPDAWLLFERTDGDRFPILLEIDRGTQHKAPFQQHLKARLEFIRSGEYAKVFGVPAVIIAYATTGQLPTYGETRRQALCHWIMEVLTELKMETWAEIFRVTKLSHAEIYQTPLFDAPVFYRPDTAQPLPLLHSAG
jgi:hypothetical protein